VLAKVAAVNRSGLCARDNSRVCPPLPNAHRAEAPPGQAPCHRMSVGPLRSSGAATLRRPPGWRRPGAATVRTPVHDQCDFGGAFAIGLISTNPIHPRTPEWTSVLPMPSPDERGDLHRYHSRPFVIRANAGRRLLGGPLATSHPAATSSVWHGIAFDIVGNCPASLPAAVASNMGVGAEPTWASECQPGNGVDRVRSAPMQYRRTAVETLGEI